MRLPVSRRRYDRLRTELRRVIAEIDAVETDLMQAEQRVTELQAQVDILLEKETK